MEALGFGFAVMGVFKNCLDGYEILAGMSAQEKSAKVLRCKLIVEERRLLSWGRAWGLMEAIYQGSTGPPNSDPTGTSTSRSMAGLGISVSSPDSPSTMAAKARFRTSRNRQIKGVEWVIEEHLSSISELLSDATTLQNRYGLSRGSEPVPSGTKGIKVSVAKKFRWAIADKEAFKELIADLRDLNDGLQTLLPENSRTVTEQALLCEMASHDVISPRNQQTFWGGGDLPNYSPHPSPVYNGTNGNGPAHSRGPSMNTTMARMNVNDMPSPPPMVREDSLIGILEEALDDYPYVQRCMQLRKAQARAGGDDGNTWSPRQNLEIIPWRDKVVLADIATPIKEKDAGPTSREEIVRRTSATYSDETWDEIQHRLVTTTHQVLVEWKPYEDDRELTEERVQRLAELFHPAGGYGAFSATEGEMRILECVGWFHDSDRMRYGLVFHVPAVNSAAVPSHNNTPSLAPPKSPNPRRGSNSSRRSSNASKPPTPPPAYSPSPTVVTLDDLLPSDSKLSKPDLGSRVILARTLARSVLQLHAANVLHKDLCSYNVLFFTPPGMVASSEDLSDVPVSSPYVSGFALARVDDDADDRTVTLASRSAARAMAGSMLPYQHPEYSPALLRQICGVASTTSMYKRAYDVYSLGCVLLEIGLWRKLRTLGWRKEYEKSVGRERWRKKLVVICDELGARCGKIYEETVRRCLLYDEVVAGDGNKGSSGGEKDLLGFCYDILGRLEGIKV